MGSGPDVGLLQANPVALGFATEVAHHARLPHQLEQRVPAVANRGQLRRPPLVQPGNGGAQGFTAGIQVDHRGPLGGQRHAGDTLPVVADLKPELLAGIADAPPVVCHLLFRPTGVGSPIGFQFHPGPGEDIALQVKQQRAHALGTVVDGQQQILVGGFHAGRL